MSLVQLFTGLLVHICGPLDKSAACVNVKKKFSYFSTETYVVGTL